MNSDIKEANLTKITSEKKQLLESINSITEEVLLN